MPIYMQLGTIKGDVTTTGFAGQIMVSSFQFGVGRSIHSPTGTGNRESSAPSVSEIVVTKVSDASSPVLFGQATKGGNLDKAVINFTQTDKGQVASYMVITLTNVMVSGYSMSSGGDKPTESLSLNFTKIEVQYSNLTATGAGSPIAAGWDLSLSKAV